MKFDMKYVIIAVFEHIHWVWPVQYMQFWKIGNWEWPLCGFPLHGTLEIGRIVEFHWKVMKTRLWRPEETMKTGRNDENSDKIRKIHDPVENDREKSRPSGKWSRKISIQWEMIEKKITIEKLAKILHLGQLSIFRDHLP